MHAPALLKKYSCKKLKTYYSNKLEIQSSSKINRPSYMYIAIIRNLDPFGCPAKSVIDI